MADNTSSIMGLFQDPALYRQAQDMAMLDRFTKMAQLDPLQQAQANLMYGGYQLGGALGGAMGAEDPMLQQLSAVQGILRQVNPIDPESMMKAAQQLAPFAPQQAADLAEKARGAALKIAQTEKATGKYGATTAAERNREMIQAVEVKLANGETLSPAEEARVRWLVSNESKPKVFRDSDTGEIIKVDPIDINTAAPNIAQLLGRKTDKSAAEAGITTTQPSKVSTPIRKELGDIDQSLTTLDNSVAKIGELLPKIETLNLGLAANVERSVKGFFGQETPDIKEFKQVFREAKKQANDILIAAKGTQTEGDAQRAYDQIADADTWKNKDLLASAFEDLAKAHQSTKNALMAKRETLISPGVPAAPEAAAPRQVPPAQSATPAQRLDADIAGLEREIKNTKPGETARLQILQDELAKAKQSKEALKAKKVTKKWSEL